MEKIREEISKLIEDNLLVIVEGKKDKISLNKLGITNIITLNKPIYETVELINDNKIVILTDLDSEGRKLYNVLRHELQRKGVKINNKLRLLLFKTRLSHIEGLHSYLE